MEEKKIGIIETVNENEKKVVFLGFGKYLGEFPSEGSEFGLDDIEINVPKVKLENGKIIDVSNVYFWGSEESINESISKYNEEGYEISYES